MHVWKIFVFVFAGRDGVIRGVPGRGCAKHTHRCASFLWFDQQMRHAEKFYDLALNVKGCSSLEKVWCDSLWIHVFFYPLKCAWIDLDVCVCVVCVCVCCVCVCLCDSDGCFMERGRIEPPDISYDLRAHTQACMRSCRSSRVHSPLYSVLSQICSHQPTEVKIHRLGSCGIGHSVIIELHPRCCKRTAQRMPY